MLRNTVVMADHFSQSSDDSAVKHAKSDAPNERTFERLVELTTVEDCRSVWTSHRANSSKPRTISNVRETSKPDSCCYVAGDSECGEITHFQSDWVDWHNSQLEIPAHEPCEKGRSGGPCHDCQTRAEQRVEHNDGLTYEEALKLRWHPKTENGIRSIPFDWSERVSLTIRKFTEMVDEYPNSRNVVNRRVTDLANEADIEVETLYPHALRAASATYHAGRGVDALNLMSIHGWEMLQTAQVYLSESTANTQRALRAAHSR